MPYAERMPRFNAWLARYNRAVTNRISRPIAGRAPGFGLVIHQGRRSGRVYETPINVFAKDAGFVVALTYGPDSQWVKNVLAAGGCELVTRTRRYRLVAPKLYRDEQRSAMPFVVRQLLRMLGVADFLTLDIAH